MKKAEKEFDCDDVELAFKNDDGDMVPIMCLEGGYSPSMDTNMLIFSTGKEEFMKMLQDIFNKTQTVDASAIDVGEKLSFENVFDDENH